MYTVSEGKNSPIQPSVEAGARQKRSVSLFFKYSQLGRQIYQIGGNEEAARLSGVQVKQVKYFVYAFSGLLSASSGLVLAARMQCGDSVRTGLGWELDAIAAVVIGGTSLSGGIGTVYGTVGGVLITATLLNIFNLLGVNPYWQRIAIDASYV